MNEIVPWIAVALTAANMVYIVLTARSKATTARVRELETRLGNKADAAQLSIYAGKLDLVEDRTTRLETDYKHLPDRETTHRLEVSILELKGQVGQLSERMQPVTAMASRIQEALIEKASGK